MGTTISKTDSIARDLRNVVQHLDTEMRTLIDLKIGAWGALSWATILNPENLLVRSCTLIPGHMFADRDYDIVNPAGLIFSSRVDHITLRAGNFALNLS